MLVNLDGPKLSRDRLVCTNIELPMSPCKPSKLQLVESPPPKRRYSGSSNSVLDKPQILKYGKEAACENDRKLQHDQFATYNQQSCNSTSSSQSQPNDTAGQDYMTVRHSREEKRNTNNENNQGYSSQDVVPPTRKKYLYQSNDNSIPSFMSINSVQGSTHTTKASSGKELISNNNSSSSNNNYSNNICMELAPGSLFDKKCTVRSSAVSTNESILSQERQNNCETQEKNLKRRGSDHKSENWRNFVSLFEDRVFMRPASSEETARADIKDKVSGKLKR